MDFLGYNVKGRMVAASCPATETLENLIECERNGAVAAILKSASSVRLNDSGKRRCLLDKEKSFFWCESGFDREIMEITKACELAKEAVKKTKLLTIPSITEMSLEPDIWLEDCKMMEKAGVHGIQLDFFYFPELMAENKFNERFVTLLKTLISECSVPIMPKLSRNFPEIYISKLLKKAGVKYVSLLDSIKVPKPEGADLTGKSLSVFGNWMFNLTRQYTYVLSNEGFQVCAGGGVVSEKEASELIRLGANTIHLATEVLLNGYKRFSAIESKLEENLSYKEAGYSGNRIITFNAEKCIGCGKCMEQSFCNVIKTFMATGDNTSCEGCGLCSQLCEGGALKMLKKE